MQKKEIKQAIYIDATPEAVWNVLTTPEGTKATFFGCVIDSTFEVGSPYAYIGPGNEGDQTVHVYGKVLAFEPHETLMLTEHSGPSYRDNHAEFETRITFSLEKVGACTKLTLVNDQWQQENPTYDIAQESWPMMLSAIKSYAESGKSLDFGMNNS